jgi:hypothetical protein
MRDLLVTKSPKKDCSIMNEFFKQFIVNYYTIVLSNRECLVYQLFSYQ